MNFHVLLLGSDANAYYMARCFHEIYNKKVDLMNSQLLGVTRYSNIINFISSPVFTNGDIFVESLNAYAKKSTFERVVLIATNDKYVRLIVENKDKLDSKFVFNYPSHEIVNNLLIKDKFYQTYSDNLDVPKTFVYPCDENSINHISDKNDFAYPVILKPSNGVEYNKHPFPGMRKVYKVQPFESLKEIVREIKNSGYAGNLIVQEFIPGDDCALYDAVFYCGTDKKVQLMTFAQIGLQERTPTGVGNCTVLVNGFDEHGYKEEIIYKMKDFLEKIGYQGFAEFDLKYDSRDGKYKILEINPRQARSSYYLSACGHNLIQSLVEDLIEHKTKQCVLVRDEMVLSFVPVSVMQKYITSKPLLQKIQTLMKEGKFVRPLHYKKDMSLSRKMYLFLKDINYIKKYKKHTW